MPAHPRVSIVIPVFNDEDWVATTLESCLAQTLSDIEVICVDDASTDRSTAVIEEFLARDPRIRLVRQPANRSAFQTRRVGILEARAPYVLFLDGDDELVPHAAERALKLARKTGADVVGFGVEVIVPEGMSVARFATDLQPVHRELVGRDIVPALFPVGRIAQGHLWRYLWDVQLLRTAYASLPDDLALYRANDIPIAFLSLVHATKYVSLPDRLYRYFWRRGVSGQAVEDTKSFEFYLGAVDSIDSISDEVERIASSLVAPEPLRASYHSARLSIIQMVLRYCMSSETTDVQARSLALLRERAGANEVLLAAATFHRAALPFLARHADELVAANERPRTVLISTGNLGSGGVQGVVVSQAKHLADAGFRVVVAVRTLHKLVHELPDGIDLVEITGRSTTDKLDSYLRILRERDVDVVIDHWVLYYDDWPYFALAARALGVPMIGWLHNFALRPVFDANARNSHLADYLPLLSKVVVLSETDVAFWKLQGIDTAVYLPNPPSPLLLGSPPRDAPRRAPGELVRLVWWGRLQQHTKRVRELVDVAAALRTRGIGFRLTIIGPDSEDLTAAELHEYATQRGVDDAIVLPGALHGGALLAALDDADINVTTSAIEGYPLTLIEAQALGLPVAMYELPWLAAVRDNDGIVTAPQGNAEALADEIATLARDADAYAARSDASLAAARAALSHDFAERYTQLLTDTLPQDTTRDATLDDARLLLRLAIDFHENSSLKAKQQVKRLTEERDSERRKRQQLETRDSLPVRGIRPLGRALLRAVPGLRPLARRVNRILRRI